MGCSTIGLVATDNKDLRLIGQRVQEVIRSIKGESKGIIKNSNIFCNPEYNPTSNFFVFSFKDNLDVRRMYVHMDCDEDFKECYGIDKKGIIFNLGCWGNSVDLMKKVLDSFQDFGDCYILENDCAGDAVLYKN